MVARPAATPRRGSGRWRKGGAARARAPRTDRAWERLSTPPGGPRPHPAPPSAAPALPSPPPAPRTNGAAAA